MEILTIGLIVLGLINTGWDLIKKTLEIRAKKQKRL
jgi:hypothetical protein